MSKQFVAILMGSDSDLVTMQATLEVLDKFGIEREIRILSAHRTPEATHAFIHDAEARGCYIFIAAAGLAAHLAGTVAGLSVKPVIGVPMEAGPLNGMDALLSTVQMPGGIPVACMAIGKTGAKNAGYLAAQIMALHDSNISDLLRQERESNAKNILDKDAILQNQRRQREE